MTAEEARREDEAYFNQEPIDPYCEWCGEQPEACGTLYYFHGFKTCASCLKEELESWPVKTIFYELTGLSTEQFEETDLKEVLIDTIADNLEALYG